MSDDAHALCNDEDCVICQRRERALGRRVHPGVVRRLRAMKPTLDRLKKRPQA